jgi:anti-sigma factor RsiW
MKAPMRHEVYAMSASERSNEMAADDVASAEGPLSRDEELLVAYLDGKLDANAAREIAERLAKDDALRARVNRLAQAWALLDELPRAKIDESFTRSTIELVAVAAEADVQRDISRRQRWQWVAGISAAGALAVATGVGFWVTNQMLPDPNRQLVQDLPIIEEMDLYQQIGSIEYLEQLADSNMFPEETGDDL